MLPKFAHLRPETLKQALHMLESHENHIHAGGSDLIGCLRDHVLDVDTVISLSRLPELTGINAARDGGLRIGAMTTLSELAGHEAINERYTALAQAAQAVGSPQLRNQGTLGGNLGQKPRCWYYRGDFHCLRKGGEQCFAYEGENQKHCIFGGELCFMVHPSDTAPALAALGAVCRVVGPSGTRSIPVEKLHVPPSVDPRRETVLEDDELITDIMLPEPAAGLRSSYGKVRARATWDFALAGVALALIFDGATVTSAKVFLSGAAPIPWRARGVEVALTGKILNPKVIRSAAEASVQGAEPLAKNAYKLRLFKGLVAEQLEAIAA